MQEKKTFQPFVPADMHMKEFSVKGSCNGLHYGLFIWCCKCVPRIKSRIDCERSDSYCGYCYYHRKKILRTTILEIILFKQQALQAKALQGVAFTLPGFCCLYPW